MFGIGALSSASWIERWSLSCTLQSSHRDGCWEIRYWEIQSLYCWIFIRKGWFWWREFRVYHPRAFEKTSFTCLLIFSEEWCRYSFEGCREEWLRRNATFLSCFSRVSDPWIIFLLCCFELDSLIAVHCSISNCWYFYKLCLIIVSLG